MHIPTALFARFWTFGAYTDNTFCEVLAVLYSYRQHFQPFLTDFGISDVYTDSTFDPFLDFSCIYRQHFSDGVGSLMNLPVALFNLFDRILDILAALFVRCWYLDEAMSSAFLPF